MSACFGIADDLFSFYPFTKGEKECKIEGIGGGDLQAIFVQLFVLYVFLLLGWVLGKWKSDYLKGTGLLSALLVNIFLPAKLFLSLNKNFTVAYIREKYVLLLAGTAALLVVVGISFLVGKLLTKEDYKQKIYRYSHYWKK